jgi:hypothetical protein
MHQEQIDFSYIANEELFEAAGKKMPRLQISGCKNLTSGDNHPLSAPSCCCHNQSKKIDEDLRSNRADCCIPLASASAP